MIASALQMYYGVFGKPEPPVERRAGITTHVPFDVGCSFRRERFI
ncbi:hypothetical protein D3OALGA1CA_3937 [Olavius algarvensis associated proteobacterium Delta 3]|nr:hypothetical protein D3OALGB2SA_2115 [Olavius algarvensis associated proteobacterium Delta 3]CAB5142517.1 hypothetical protein D3OALGA1CA_3937 [Olavius algarvensis associated proteobacterium Delta 3]